MGKTVELPSLPSGFHYRLDLVPSATSRLLKKRRVHRWYYFPHSYSPELVEAILGEWRLPRGGRLLDPFVGAGTTLLCAQHAGLNSVGVDNSPLAVRVSNAKTDRYSLQSLRHGLGLIQSMSSNARTLTAPPQGRLASAFSAGEYLALNAIRAAIELLDVETAGFFWLALLATARHFSRAVANGGWYRWVEKPDRGEEVSRQFEQIAMGMMADLEGVEEHYDTVCQARLGDAREVRYLGQEFDGVITSPPYPNRHDYTRVYHIELLLMGYTEGDISAIRHSSLRSHVEARLPATPHHLPGTEVSYEMPETLMRALEDLPDDTESRVRRMLKGYFRDLHDTIFSCANVLKSGGRMALVVGNVRHNGIMIRVDEVLMEIAERLGFMGSECWVIRLRGNSAQQMRRYGREPSRESVVFLRKP